MAPSTPDPIVACLNLAPVPYLGAAYSMFKCLWAAIEGVQFSKQQLEALAFCVAQFLQTLTREVKAGRIDKSSPEIANFERIIQDINDFIKAEAKCSFLKLLFTKDIRIATIETYHRRMAACVGALQISTLIQLQDWQRRNDFGKAIDQRILYSRLSDLETSYFSLENVLDAHCTDTSMKVALKKSITRKSSDERECRFFRHILNYLVTKSGEPVEVENWMVTAFEVEFGKEIGAGGFGRVFEGTWNRTRVALKVLKTNSSRISNSTIFREIRVWMDLRHPNILPFFGANVFDEKPFIVMQHVGNGNAREYIREHPNCNRLSILHQISQGLVYLHAKDVIHGDLKATNVLIDEPERALLCDFGLARIECDTGSGWASAGTGSRNWMSPERLLEGCLQKPADIYAFGMTMYEVINGRIPLDDLSPSRYNADVVHGDTRPLRPKNNSFKISDELWSLAEKCWLKAASQRPIADHVCKAMESISNAMRTPVPDHSLNESSSGQLPESAPSPLSSNKSEPNSQLASSNKIPGSIPQDRLSKDDVIIALIGPTGTGKSSFLEKATGFSGGVGHDLQSFTDEIVSTKVCFPEYSDLDIVFVDTPGFDDSRRSDGEILEMLSQWLKKTYERGVTLSGILYFHRISDSRMARTPFSNLNVFQKLCGTKAFRNVVLTTTMWDEVDTEEGDGREKELKTKYWKTMIDQGSTVSRYLNTMESAWRIVTPIILDRNERFAVELQHEMVKQRKKLPDTKAGMELYNKLEALLPLWREKLGGIRAEMEGSGNESDLRRLKADHEELCKKIGMTIADMDALRLPLRKRLVNRLLMPLGLMKLFLK